MASKDEIVNGPGKWDLVLAVFVEGSTANFTQGDGVVATLEIWSLTCYGKTKDNWKIGGLPVARDGRPFGGLPVEFTYSTQTRKGTVQGGLV